MIRNEVQINQSLVCNNHEALAFKYLLPFYKAHAIKPHVINISPKAQGTFHASHLEITLFYRSEVFTTVTMKNAVVWDLALYIFCVNLTTQHPRRRHSTLF
jgi:hypothetical protein